MRTREAIATVGRNFLLYSPYSVDLASTLHFHLFGPLKDAFRGRRLAYDEELKHSTRDELRRFNRVLRKRRTASYAKWKRCVVSEGNLVEK